MDCRVVIFRNMSNTHSIRPYDISASRSRRPKLHRRNALISTVWERHSADWTGNYSIGRKIAEAVSPSSSILILF